jgi:putative transport protein
MEIDFYSLLAGYEELLFFVVLGLGYLAGKIRIGPFALGPPAGVLLAGLFFGALGLPSPSPVIQNIGFILFIYSVGVEAGPHFFAVFLEDGYRYLTLAVVIAATALGLTSLLSWVLNLDSSLAAGLMAGALTSTPTLAAAQDAVTNGMAGIAPHAMQKAIQEIGAAYAITYLFGLVGLIVFVRFLPHLARVDLKAESRELATQRGIKADDEESLETGQHFPLVRAYEIKNEEFTGRSLAEIAFQARTGCMIQKIKRGSELIEPGKDTALQKDDRVSLIGLLAHHKGLKDRLGPEIIDADILDGPLNSMKIVVNNRNVAGRKIRDLHLMDHYACFLNDWNRSNVELPRNFDLALAKGDVLTVTGTRERLRQLAGDLGSRERDVNQTDFLTFCFGIAAGLLLSTLMVKIGALSIGLGTAGGLLISGILVGSYGARAHGFGRIPPAASLLLKELGLLFFMAAVGLKTGDGILDALLTVGPVIFLCGMAVTTVPVIVGFFFGLWVLRLNPAILVGALTGAMTSTPALRIVSEATGSSIPALGYAGTYTFANVFLAAAGTLIMMML